MKCNDEGERCGISFVMLKLTKHAINRRCIYSYIIISMLLSVKLCMTLGFFIHCQVPERVHKLVYEVELAVIIGKRGRNIPETAAMEYVGGYALALDMTAGDVHAIAKEKGHPWCVAKGFDTFCPISGLVPTSAIDPFDTKLWLKVDGEIKQNGSTSDMIFSVPYLISYISRIFTLEAGDVILTGTPEGVGPVKPGQTITAGIEGVVEMNFPVVQRK